MCSSKQIKELAECNAIYEFEKTVNMYGKEYIRYYYNKLAELNGSINSTCNCQRNSNSIDNEPCCRCDSRKENREVKIVTVSDLIKILDTKENRYGATGKPRILNLSLNGNFAGSIENVKLDGYGDGLITDVTMEITSSKFTTTNADMIRNMSDEELADFLDIVGEDGISSQYADVPCDCCCEKTECSKCWKDWLKSEAE
jgi:hypothetical protein|nr:MAG TPA: hypothetical protein [Caudoviricetes sp.]